MTQTKSSRSRYGLRVEAPEFWTPKMLVGKLAPVVGRVSLAAIMAELRKPEMRIKHEKRPAARGGLDYAHLITPMAKTELLDLGRYFGKIPSRQELVFEAEKAEMKALASKTRGSMVFRHSHDKLSAKFSSPLHASMQKGEGRYNSDLVNHVFSLHWEGKLKRDAALMLLYGSNPNLTLRQIGRPFGKKESAVHESISRSIAHVLSRLRRTQSRIGINR
jgi:hypothetical protein